MVINLVEGPHKGTKGQVHPVTDLRHALHHGCVVRALVVSQIVLLANFSWTVNVLNLGVSVIFGIRHSASNMPKANAGVVRIVLICTRIQQIL